MTFSSGAKHSSVWTFSGGVGGSLKSLKMQIKISGVSVFKACSTIE